MPIKVALGWLNDGFADGCFHVLKIDIYPDFKSTVYAVCMVNRLLL